MGEPIVRKGYTKPEVRNIDRTQVPKSIRKKLLAELQKRREEQLRKLRSSPTWYKDSVNPENFRVIETDKWVYKDPYKEDYKYDYEVFLPHLILQDKFGFTRFIIGYLPAGDRIIIRSIQGTRTKKTYEQETEASKKFQKELGVHPGEFLLCEFLNKFKLQILTGKRIVLEFIGKTETFENNYMPLIDRYFKNVRYNGIGFDAELDLTKPRVKAILGLQ
jgi:hypothetical protein